MKKHSEGYALPFVLVVMVVLCMVSVSILSFSLKNLQSQQASIDRIKAQYEAAGEIEKVIGTLENAKNSTITLNSIFDPAEITLTEEDISYDLEVSPKKLTATFTVAKKTVQITCVLEISSSEDIVSIQDNGTAIYKFTNPTYKYVSYTISTVETAEPEPDTENGGDPQ